MDNNYLEKLIDQFNQGELKTKELFGGNKAFFKILDKRGLLDELDIDSRYNTYWINDFIIYQYENHKDLGINLIKDALGDIIFENGSWYLHTDAYELSRLFCNNRYTVSRSIVEKLLSGEYPDEIDYQYDTDDIYRDVIEFLNKENIEALSKRIITAFEGDKMPSETELLEEIAKGQGHPEYVIINSENIQSIIDYKDTLEKVLEFDESYIYSELQTIYRQSYSTSYYNHIYKAVFESLDEYFAGEAEFIGNDELKLKIKDFEHIIIDFLKHDPLNDITYHGTFINLLVDEGYPCLSVDSEYGFYPSYNESKKYINEIFQDYI